VLRTTGARTNKPDQKTPRQTQVRILVAIGCSRAVL
jgi:hypothetical protein